MCQREQKTAPASDPRSHHFGKRTLTYDIRGEKKGVGHHRGAPPKRAPGLCMGHRGLKGGEREERRRWVLGDKAKEKENREGMGRMVGAA